MTPLIDLRNKQWHNLVHRHTCVRRTERPTPAMMTAAQFAARIRIPARTAAHWLAVWSSLGVDGIAVERSRGRHGYRYLVCPSLVTRWLDCELPAPRLAA